MIIALIIKRNRSLALKFLAFRTFATAANLCDTVIKRTFKGRSKGLCKNVKLFLRKPLESRHLMIRNGAYR